MAHFEVLSTTRRVVLPRLGRVATGAALAIALGCGVAPIASVVAPPPVAWADEAAQGDTTEANLVADDAAVKETEPVAVAANTALTPRGKWAFDGDDLKTNTGSENSLSMSEHTGVTAVQSPVKSLGKMMRFDSKTTDTNVRIPSAIQIGSDYTISMWIKADAGIENGEKTAILQMDTDNGRTLLYQLADGRYATFFRGDNNGGEHIFNMKNPGRGSWHHVTFVKNGQGNNGTQAKSFQLYIDGELAGQGTWQNNLNGGTTTPALLIGEHKNVTDMDRFQGDIDEFCIFGTALTQAQVKEHYDSYGQAKSDIALINAKAELQALIGRAESLAAQSDGNEAYVELKEAIDHAKNLSEAATLDQVNAAKSELEDAIGGVFALGIKVNVDQSKTIETVDKGIFGINHRYAFNGYGSYDSVNQKVKDDFAELYDESNFGSIRYPGGTISNLFSWKETLGEQSKRTPQIHGFYNNKGQGGIAPNFGISEIGTFAADHGSEIIYVYSLGRGDANDASDLIEFLNAKVGDNPNGGTDWAQVRADNGHPDPYNVRYFEIGNEMNQGGEDGTRGQQYWTTTVMSDPNNEGGGNKSAVDAYIEGGTVKRVQEYAVVRGDWNKAKSKSTGEPNQEFGMRYALLPRDEKASDYENWTAIDPESVEVKTYTVTAGPNETETDSNPQDWIKVKNFDNSSAADKHYVLDEKTGFIKFGDGNKGAIPTAGHRVKVSYKVKRDGFVQISEAMRDTMMEINEQRAEDGQEPGEIHVYSSFEGSSFYNGMNNRGKNDLYDGIAIHPYSGDLAKTLAGNDFYLQAMSLGNGAVDRVRRETEEMRGISDDETKVPVISEYGIFRSEHTMVRSQAHALYIARQIMEYIKLGSPYIQKHCLVDWYSDGGDSLGPTQQAVIQAVAGADADTKTGEGSFTFFKTPSALVFEMYNGKGDTPGFGDQILSATTSELPTLDNGVKSYDVLTSKDVEGNYYAAITYLDLEEDGAFTLNVKGEDFTGRKIEVRSIVGDSYDTENTPDEPNKVTVNYEDAYTSTEANPHFTLKPHSFTIVKVCAEEPPAQHTVTFTVDGATWATQTVTDGGLATVPAEPAKDGYRFVAWTLNGEAYDFKTPVTSDLTLVASFEKIDEPAPPAQHTVTFTVDGAVYHTATVADGECVTAPADPTKEGCTFKGWTLDDKAFDFNTPITGDVTLEAVFAKDAADPGTTGGGKPGTSGGLPQTGDPVALVGAVALAGAGVALAGNRLRRRK